MPCFMCGGNRSRSSIPPAKKRRFSCSGGGLRVFVGPTIDSWRWVRTKGHLELAAASSGSTERQHAPLGHKRLPISSDRHTYRVSSRAEQRGTPLFVTGGLSMQDLV
jgi:hypothetical protein